MSTTKIVALFIAGIFMSGCSVYMAAHQPEQKNFAVLTEGTHQSLVRTELGLPVWSGKDDQGFDVDVFQFVQGYTKGAKVGRAVWHGIADVFTIGLWEIIGTPVETIASGTKIKATVTYDEQQKVKTVKLHDDKGNEIPLQKKSEE
jgi:hypothetical protein